MIENYWIPVYSWEKEEELELFLFKQLTKVMNFFSFFFFFFFISNCKLIDSFTFKNNKRNWFDA